MKRFSQYITELFDRKIPVRSWDTGGSTESYLFTLMRNSVTGRLEIAPEKAELDALVEKWIGKHGGDGISELNKEAPAFAYVVSFTDISRDNPKIYSELQLMSDGDIMDRVWEISFVMKAAEITKRTTGRPSTHGKYTYNWKSSTDEDINQFSGPDAAMILGGVVDAAREFYRAKNPRGFIIGTKPTANPARGRIYKALARVAGRELGGDVTDIPYARSGMKDGAMIWFDRSNPFKLVGLPTSP